MLAAPETRTRTRAEITDASKWRLDDIYPDWKSWEGALAELERRIGEYAALKGTLGRGPADLTALIITLASRLPMRLRATAM